MEKYCDILVAGTDLSGLLTAAALARRGMSVSILPLIPKHASQPSVEPHCFFPLNSNYLKAILSRLGISDEDLPRKEITPVFLQIIMPGHRLDLSTDPAVFSDELDREFPKAKETILGLYQTLDDYRKAIDQERLEDLFLPETFWDRYKLKRFVRDAKLDQKVSDFFENFNDISTNREFPALFESQLRHVSDAFTPKPFLYQVAKFLSLSDRGYGEVEGGIETLTRLLLQRIAEYGGKILDPRHIDRIDFERRYVSSITLDGFDGTIRPKYVLWNRSLRDLAPYIPDTFSTRRFIRKLNTFHPTHYRFCVQFTLPRLFWPVGMHDQSLVVADLQSSLEAENCLYVQKQAHAREELLTISVHYLLKTDAIHESPDHFGERHARIRSRLLELMPFAEEALHVSFPKLNTADAFFDPQADLQATLFPIEKSPFELFLEAARVHPVYEQATQSFIDLFSLDYRTPIRNLFITSPELLMHFGLDGKVIIAQRLAKLLRERTLKQQSKALRKRKRIV